MSLYSFLGKYKLLVTKEVSFASHPFFFFFHPPLYTCLKQSGCVSHPRRFISSSFWNAEKVKVCSK